MAELSTIARPYAQGVFAVAQAGNNFQHWSTMLSTAAEAAQTEQLTPLLNTSLVNRTALADVFIEACGDALDDQGRNLIRLLADNRRLGMLAQIHEQFELLRGEAEGTIDATMVAAQEVDKATQDKVAKALGQRLNRKVALSTETDPSLLGGAVIRAGDLVIDGSARGRLERLADAMSR
jgi:F-type H+-transporting ATPase subunit delta